MELHEKVNGWKVHSFRDRMMGGYPIMVSRPGESGRGTLEGFVRLESGEDEQKRHFDLAVARVKSGESDA